MRLKIKLWFPLILFAELFCSDCYTQTPDFSFQNITPRQGLPYPDVNCVLKDHEGFMWIGSSGGLFRYEGTRFDSFKRKPDDSTSLSNNVVSALLETTDGVLLCGTRNGLSILNRQTGKFKNYDIVIPGVRLSASRFIYSMLEEKKGIIWLATSAGLVRFEPDKNLFTPFLHDPHDATSMSCDTLYNVPFDTDSVRHGFWIATARGLNFFSYDDRKFYNYLNNPGQEAIFDDKNYQAVSTTGHVLWAYCRTDTAIISYDLVSKQKEKYVYLHKVGEVNYITDVNAFGLDKNKNIIFSGWQVPPVYFNTRSHQFTTIPYDSENPFSILGTFLHRVSTDSDGNVWFCMLDGISIWSPETQKFLVYNPAKYLNPSLTQVNRRIMDIKEDPSGIIWIATDGGGIVRFDRKSKTFESFRFMSDNIKDNKVFTICILNGELWLGTSRGIKIFNPITKSFRIFEEIKDSVFNSKTVYKLMEDSEHHLWIYHFTKGLYRYDPATHTYIYFLPNRQNPSSVKSSVHTSMLQDKNGSIWFSTSYGFSKYVPGDSSFIHYDINTADPTDFQSTVMMKIYEDSRGLIWLLSDAAGIATLDRKTMKKQIYTDLHGLRSLFVEDVAEDSYGNLWMGTNNGMMRWIRAENRFEGVDTYFGQRITSYSRLLRLKDGNIMASNGSSLLEIIPRRFNTTYQPGKVLIGVLNVFDKRKTVNPEGMSLSYQENFFSIGFSCLSEAWSNKIEYAYMLEGFDKDWVYSGGRRFAAYTNVPGGDYLFKVKARTGNNPWTVSPSQLSFSITNVFYKSWWFRSAMGVLIAGLILLFLRYRDRQREKAEAQKSIAYFAESVYGQNSPEEVMWDLARNVVSRLGFVECVIYLLDEDKNMLIQKAALGPKNPEGYHIANTIEIAVGSGIVGSVAQSGRSEIVRDTSKDKRYIADDQVRRSEITVPIIHEGKVIGIIDSEHPKKNFFTKDDLKILETIASICSTKIVKARAMRDVAEKEKELLEYDKKIAEIRLMALRSQMNPHFIFNCLNSIDKFILMSDEENASAYLNKFARLIRLILNQSDKMTTTLIHEIEMLEYYIQLETLRFENKFSYEIKVDDNIDRQETEVPTMLLQPFVENAIWHGFTNKKENGKIMIALQQHNSHLKCVIEDNGIGRQKSAELNRNRTIVHQSKGVKLSKDRIEAMSSVHTDTDIIFTDLVDAEGNAAGTRVEILIPLND